MKLPTDLPSSLLDALKWCLTYNARARPSVRQLLDIPYLQPPRPPIPPAILHKVHHLLSPEEYELLLKARV